MMDSKMKCRSILFYKDYFEEFFVKQPVKVKEKILWTLELITDLPMVPKVFLKHISGTDGLFEIRVNHRNVILRIFCFFDQGRLIVIANGFLKKTQKTPGSEINKALKIKQEYESEKK
jgi:phage-related protein